jgi:hypothetical protein
VAFHRREQADGVSHVVLIEAERKPDRLANLDERREVQHGVKSSEREEAVQKDLVLEVADDQACPGADRGGVTGAEIVDDGDVVAGSDEGGHGVTTGSWSVSSSSTGGATSGA